MGSHHDIENPSIRRFALVSILSPCICLGSSRLRLREAGRDTLPVYILVLQAVGFSRIPQFIASADHLPHSAGDVFSWGRLSPAGIDFAGWFRGCIARVRMHRLNLQSRLLVYRPSSGGSSRISEPAQDFFKESHPPHLLSHDLGPPLRSGRRGKVRISRTFSISFRSEILGHPPERASVRDFRIVIARCWTRSDDIPDSIPSAVKSTEKHLSMNTDDIMPPNYDSSRFQNYIRMIFLSHAHSREFRTVPRI